MQNDQRWMITNDYGFFLCHFLMCPEMKEGVPLRGGVAKWAAFFLFFTTIALYFDIVGVSGPCMSLPNK